MPVAGEEYSCVNSPQHGPSPVNGDSLVCCGSVALAAAYTMTLLFDKTEHFTKRSQPFSGRWSQVSPPLAEKDFSVCKSPWKGQRRTQVSLGPGVGRARLGTEQGRTIAPGPERLLAGQGRGRTLFPFISL